MPRFAIPLLLVTISLAGSTIGWAAESYHTKVMPYSVDYPMITPGHYPRAGSDSYRASFGTIRLFKSVIQSDLNSTIKEAVHFNKLYGTYGVLGRGEEVFTERAARFRAAHQGR
ncbi:MAG: hypothetical protein AB1646_18415 [Thermodesulfobacteriota bacterium]